MSGIAPKHLGVFIPLLLVTVLHFCAPQTTYYVKPTPDTPCHYVFCHTLSEYVNETERYFTSNTKMIFLPGEHTLQWNLTISGTSRLAFLGNPDTSRDCMTKISSIDATITFTDILMLEITALDFLSCGVWLDNTSGVFQNVGFENNTSNFRSAIHVHNSNVTFKRSWFENNTAVHGGAIHANISTIMFEGETRFEGNTAAAAGGGVFAEGTNLTFHGNSTFINNAAKEQGGGISIVQSDIKFTGYTTFISNIVTEYGDYYYQFGGGGIHAYDSSLELGFGSTISVMDNSADFGGGMLLRLSTVSFSGVCDFIHNSAFRYGGGVCIVSSSVSFAANSSIVNNSATRGGGVSAKWSNVCFAKNSSFIDNIIAWRTGGGVYANISTISFADNSSFINNSGATFGGGIFASNCTVNFSNNSNFIHNSAQRDGGGVFVRTSNVSFANDSSFTNNSGGVHGGGISMLQSIMSFAGNSHFMHNTARTRGGGMFIDHKSIVIFGGKCRFTENSATHSGGCLAAEDSTVNFSDSTFTNNSASYGGCIFVEKCNISLSGTNSFFQNSAISGNMYTGGSSDNVYSGGNAYSTVGGGGDGGAILSLSSIMIFGGTQELTENSANHGGAVYLSGLDNKLYLGTNTTTYFNGNHALYRGGALFVENDLFTYCFRDEDIQQDFRTYCFFQMLEYHNSYCELGNLMSPLVDSHGIELQFQDNAAIETGSVLYGGNIEKCGVCITNAKSDEYVTGEVAFNAWANISRQFISSDPYQVCICVHGHPNCNQNDIEIKTFPGATFVLPVVSLGQFSGIVPTVIRTYISEETFSLDDLQSTQLTNNKCTSLQYTLSSKDINKWSEGTLHLYADEPCSVFGQSLDIHVKLIPCPPAFSLSSKQTCTCEQRLQKYTIECNINDQSILREDNVWVGFDETSQALIIHEHCPFDYCKPESESINFTMNNTDLQCNHNRSSQLCGACQHGLSLVLGSSRCLPCSNKFLALLILFAFSGLALVVFLFVCQLTVAAGTISGLIFYVNVVTVNQSIFFPSGETNIFTVFIAWLNLDLGIETCLFEGMDAYSKTWLQFAFPLYIWLLVGLITFICNVSTTAARIIGSTNPIAVLATLFLLSYTKLLRTVIAAFSSTTLEYTNDETKVVWLYDGNIGYLDKNDGRHIALFLFSLLVFLFLFVPYTLFLLLGQCILPRLNLNKLRCLSWSNYVRIKSFLDAYHAPYKDKHRYWIGLLLLLRFILFLVSAIVDIQSPQDPHVNLLVMNTSIFLLAMWVLNTNGGVYQKRFLNVLESSFILNLAILATATYQVKLAGGSQAAVFYTSVAVAFSTFIGIIAYHVYQRLRDSRFWRTLARNHIERRRARDHGSQGEDTEETEEMLPQAAPKPPTVTYFEIPTEERREMRPITPPLSPGLVNFTDVREPLDLMTQSEPH